MELGAMFRLKTSDVPPRILDSIKKELTVRQRGGEKYGFGRGQTIVLYREQGEFIEIPRHYALGSFSVFTDKTVEGTGAPFTFTRQLRPHQIPVIDAFMSKLGGRAAPFGGILAAPCGTGKTIEAINILSRLGRKAIVLVHAEFLMRQWEEAILGGPNKPAFTDLKPEDIGHIQQDMEDWEDKTIVLAMVETLINRDYDKAFYDSFGVVVLDEVHRHGAAEWHKAMTRFPARYRIGLSATPSRGDGLWNVIKFHIGNVIAQGDEAQKATVYVIDTGVAVHDEFYKQYDKQGEETDNIFLARLLKVLCKSDFRNRLIADEVFKAVNAGRRVLVLSDRLAHLDEIERLYKERLPEEDRMAAEMADDPSLLKIGRYVGGVSKADIERAKECNLLLGTFQYAKEGLDDPGLDTLILATPKGDVIQAVGRILRIAEGKKPPIVVDIVDEKTEACRDFYNRRAKRYLQRGYEIKKIEKPR